MGLLQTNCPSYSPGTHACFPDCSLDSPARMALCAVPCLGLQALELTQQRVQGIQQLYLALAVRRARAVQRIKAGTCTAVVVRPEGSRAVHKGEAAEARDSGWGAGSRGVGCCCS